MNRATARFRCSDPLAGDFEFADVEDVLDALEAALVSPDTPMLDTARQSWQPVAAHPEIRAAWIERSRFRPPTGTGLTLPELPALAAVAATSGDAESARRREAYARVRGLPVREQVPAEEIPHSGRPLAILVLVGSAVLLGLIGWGIVSLAIRLAAVAAGAAGVAAGS